MIIINHQLTGKDIQHYPCFKNELAIKHLSYIVIHYTASHYMPSTINQLINPKIEASAHIVIGRKGEIAQLVPFNIQSWHAGESHYKGLKHMNQYSIGIELMNTGKLKKINETYYTDYGKIIPQEQVYTHVEKNRGISYWHSYSKIQIQTLQQVCEVLQNRYPSIKEIIGHENITSRKIDPGKAFPWQFFFFFNK